MHCAISSQRKERHDSSIFVMSIWLSVSLITHFCISGLGVFYVFRRCYNGTMEQQVGSTNSGVCESVQLVLVVALVYGPVGSFGPVM